MIPIIRTEGNLNKFNYKIDVGDEERFCYVEQLYPKQKNLRKQKLMMFRTEDIDKKKTFVNVMTYYLFNFFL